MDNRYQRLFAPTPEFPPLSSDQVHEAEAFARELGETDARPVAQIRAIVAIWGANYARATVARATAIHQSAGMKRRDGRGNRTVGGIFFWLIRANKASEPDPAVSLVFPNALARSRARALAQALTHLSRAARPRRKPKSQATSAKSIPPASASSATRRSPRHRPNLPRPAAKPASANSTATLQVPSSTPPMPRKHRPRVVEVSRASSWAQRR